jgi:type I restriction enzyme S subunit
MYERNRLYYDYFKRIPVPYPPIDEQEKIVAVIHQKSREFQNLISVKRRLIELLNERKLEIISRAMTRGLDSNVRLKPSGSEWLGDVPQHWEIKPLKRWVNINERTLQENTDPNYSFYYIDIGSVGTGYLINQPEKMLFSNAPSRARRMLKCGDTIISTVRTYLKAIYFISAKIENHIASTGFAVLAPKSEVNPEYLSYLIQSNFFIDHVTANSKGVAYPAITESEMGTFYVPIPPDINEQKEILNSIKKSITPIDEIINKIRDEIEFILEYRTRLISDIITGKVDIRYEKITTIPVTSPNESDIVRPDDDLFSSEEDD